MENSIIKVGATLAIATFLIIVLFFVISGPMTSMFDSFDDVDAGEASDEMNEFLPDIRGAFWMGIAIAIITPSVIFVLWIFHREPDWYYRRRYR